MNWLTWLLAHNDTARTDLIYAVEFSMDQETWELEGFLS